MLTTKRNKKQSSQLYEYTCKPWKMNSSLIHSITEMNLKRYGLITKILSAKKTYRLKFPIVDACVPASLSHVYICSQHLIYVYVGFIFFQKNLVTLICCYSLLSGGLNKWLLHLNAGKMRNKPDYTNQKQRYHSWLQRYSLGNWLVQGPREWFEWQRMEYTDWLICWQSSSSWWYPKARARTMENTESAFLVSSEVSGSKTFSLA